MEALEKIIGNVGIVRSHLRVKDKALRAASKVLHELEMLDPNATGDWAMHMKRLRSQVLLAMKGEMPVDPFPDGPDKEEEWPALPIKTLFQLNPALYIDSEAAHAYCLAHGGSEPCHICETNGMLDQHTTGALDKLHAKHAPPGSPDNPWPETEDGPGGVDGGVQCPNGESLFRSVDNLRNGDLLEIDDEGNYKITRLVDCNCSVSDKCPQGKNSYNRSCRIPMSKSGRIEFE